MVLRFRVKFGTCFSSGRQTFLSEKCSMVVETQEDRDKFQAMLDSLAQWSADWQMLFNVEKCHVMHAGRKNPEFL